MTMTEVEAQTPPAGATVPPRLRADAVRLGYDGRVVLLGNL